MLKVPKELETLAKEIREVILGYNSENVSQDPLETLGTKKLLELKSILQDVLPEDYNSSDKSWKYC